MLKFGQDLQGWKFATAAVVAVVQSEDEGRVNLSQWVTKTSGEARRRWMPVRLKRPYMRPLATDDIICKNCCPRPVKDPELSDALAGKVEGGAGPTYAIHLTASMP